MLGNWAGEAKSHPQVGHNTARLLGRKIAPKRVGSEVGEGFSPEGT